MPSTQEFRRRIKSVNNTKQITKAMEMIASIKMQKSVKTAGLARSYTQNSWNMLETLARLTSPENHPMLVTRPAGRTAVILITADRGLCGSYNSEVIKKFNNFVKENPAVILSNAKNLGDPSAKPQDDASHQISPTTASGRNDIDVIAIGKKGAAYVRRYGIGNLIAEFPSFESSLSYEEIVPVSKISIDEYLAGTYDRVVVVYSHFVSSLKQLPAVKQILPITSEHIDIPELWEPRSVILSGSEGSREPVLSSSKDSSVSPQNENLPEFKFEPDPDTVLDRILPQFVRAQVYGAILEANASMYSAQMVAMKSATDNAGNLIDELQLVYNTVRQGNITREIAEISGAAEAMK